MKMKAVCLLAGIVGLALVACSADEGAAGAEQGTVSSCDLGTTGGYCLDFAANAPVGTAQANCDNARSTVGWVGVVRATDTCPAASRVGSCATVKAGIAIVYRYYSPMFTTDKAQVNCAGLAGQFTAN
jgi:hypothetical protein